MNLVNLGSDHGEPHFFLFFTQFHFWEKLIFTLHLIT